MSLSSLATKYLHCDTNATYTIKASRLHHLLVNTGVSNETVTVRFASTDDPIAVIAADLPLDSQFDLDFRQLATLEIVLSSASLDVTVTYS